MGEDVEDILTLYYNNVVLTTDTTKLTKMHTKVSDVRYNHSQRTMELYKKMITSQRKKTIVTLKAPIRKEKGCCNPFE